jgi:hypothetical protein
LNNESFRRYGREVRTYLASLLPAREVACFVIFAQGRTGTWLLRDLLNSHPKVQCDKEILQQRVLLPMRCVKGHVRCSARTVYGFHVQINQLLSTQPCDPYDFMHALDNQGWHILYLKRNDIVRQSLSTMIAHQRQEWVTTQANPLDGQRFTIDPQALLDWLRRRVEHQALEAYILKNLDHLCLDYETHLQDSAVHQQTMDRVFEYLRLETMPVSTVIQKIMPQDLREVIANYDVVEQAVRQSAYAGYWRG